MFKNFLSAFIVFLFWSFFGMWYYTCQIKDICSSSKENPTATEQIKIKSEDSNKNPSKPLVKTKSNNTTKTDILAKGFLIKALDTIIQTDRTDNQVIEAVFEFLNKNQDQEIVIIGLYNKADSIFNPHLGLKRASLVKSQLVNYGINPDKLSVDEIVKDFQYDDKKLFKNGILFLKKTLTEERTKLIEYNISNKTLYSGFDSKGFKADNTLHTYALELKSFLQKYPEKSVLIIGHTDSTGDEAANMWFGMERARNVKDHLVSQGINADRIIVDSKGESQPVESNATIEGRRMNRRIEITVN